MTLNRTSYYKIDMGNISFFSVCSSSMKQVGFVAIKYDAMVSINNVFFEPEALQMMRQIKVFFFVWFDKERCNSSSTVQLMFKVIFHFFPPDIDPSIVKQTLEAFKGKKYCSCVQ